MILKKRQKSQREPTIALINIVFLMLVFFLVAGTIARPIDKDLKLVKTADLEGAAPANAMVIHPDGAISVYGETVSDAKTALAKLDYQDGTVRIIPDRDLPATDLVRLGAQLRGAGAERVVIVTEKALE